MEFEEARHQANVFAKAKELFARGYSGRWDSSEVVEIVSPAGVVYRVDVWEQTCPCPHFEEHGYCSHLWGWPFLLKGMAQEGACGCQRTK